MRSLIRALWAKITGKNLLPKYDFVQLPDEEVTSVKILEGKYKDIIYSYGSVSLNEVGQTTLTFSFEVKQSGQHAADSLNVDEEFHKMIGDILTDIIIKEVQLNESIRNLDTEKSYL